MSEIEKRIATTWPGPPTTADLEATRLADLRAVKVDLDALAEKIDVQADIVGQLGASFHLQSNRLSVQSQDMAALRKRIEALESQPRIVTAGSQDDDRVSPAPPAPLVERMAEAMLQGRHGDVPANAGVRSLYRDDARAALLVAAEELLGDLTDEEVNEGIFDPLGVVEVNAVLRARLARAKEAAK